MPVLFAYLSLVLIWSTTPLTVQWSTLGAGFVAGIFFRMLIGAAVCYVLLRVVKHELHWNRDSIKLYGASTIGIFGAMGLVYWGAQYIPSGLIAIIFGMTPLFTALLARLVLKQDTLSPARIIGVLVAISGLVLIFHTNLDSYPDAAMGIIALVVATLLHSFSTVLTEKYHRNQSALSITTGALLVSLPAFFLVWLLDNSRLPDTIPLQASLSILYLGVVGTGLGFTLYYYALKKTSSASIALVTLVSPVCALLLGAAINNEPLTLHIIIGSALIVTGLLINQQKALRSLKPVRLRTGQENR